MERPEPLPCRAEVKDISNIGVLTLGWNRETGYTESFNETTLDIYVQPYDTDYFYTGPTLTMIDETENDEEARRFLRPRGRLGGFGTSSANYNLTWEVIEETPDHVLIQLYFEQVLQISAKIK